MVDRVRSSIRSARIAKQLTAAAVAERIGISRPFYTQLEGGTRRLGLAYFIGMVNALRLDVGSLLGETPLGVIGFDGNPATIRARIRHIREEKNKTAADVAKVMHISRPFYTQ